MPTFHASKVIVLFIQEADFGIEKLLSETRSVSKVRKRKSTPEVSAEVSSFVNPVSSTQKCRSESISSRNSTDKRSSSVSSQDSSHSSRTGSTSFSSSRSSDSRSSYSSSRSSSVTSSSSSRHKSPQSSRRIASPSPKYRMKTSFSHNRHHRDWSPRRSSPRRPHRPPFNQSHTPSLRSSHYRHSIRSRSPVRMHHSDRRHSPSRGKLSSHHYDDRTRHSYLPVHRNRSPLSSRIWHRSRRSPPRYNDREQHGQRDKRRSYQSQKRLSHHISSIDRSPDSKLHSMKKLSHDSRYDQKKSSLSSNDTTVKEGSPTHLEQKRRKRQLHDSNDSIDQDANKVAR